MGGRQSMTPPSPQRLGYKPRDVDTSPRRLSYSLVSLRVPLRRVAGERVGPIAKQWEGEVVLQKNQMLRLQTPQPTSPSPRKRGSPPSPPTSWAERASDAICESDSPRRGEETGPQ